MVPNAPEDRILEHEHGSQMVGDSQTEPGERRDPLMEVRREVLREEAAVTDTTTGRL